MPRITDRVGDFIIRLKNAGDIALDTVSAPHSKFLEAIARKLQSLGYLKSVEVSKKMPKTIDVELAYNVNGEHMITGVKRISKPGRRLYVHSKDAHSVKSGTGARIISTPKGILTDAEARKNRTGGEDLFIIW
jgi:small subunit ribosomal protein S8